MRYRSVITGLLLIGTFSQPAWACRMTSQIELDDVKYAEVVLVGRISNYEIVRDHEFRRRMLAVPTLSADLRKIYSDPNETLLGDYARFDIHAVEVLRGSVPKKISVTWDNSTFGEPKTMDPGLYLIALRNPASRTPPLRGPSATIFPNREPQSLTVLQAPCSSPFMFKSDSADARTIRMKLSRPTK